MQAAVVQGRAERSEFNIQQKKEVSGGSERTGPNHQRLLAWSFSCPLRLSALSGNSGCALKPTNSYCKHPETFLRQTHNPLRKYSFSARTRAGGSCSTSTQNWYKAGAAGAAPAGSELGPGHCWPSRIRQASAPRSEQPPLDREFRTGSSARIMAYE